MQKPIYFLVMVGFLYLSLIISFTSIDGENLQNVFLNSTISKINEWNHSTYSYNN
jgi:hypothetical protein